MLKRCLDDGCALASSKHLWPIESIRQLLCDIHLRLPCSALVVKRGSRPSLMRRHFSASFPNAVSSWKVSPTVGGNTGLSGKVALSLTATYSKRETTSDRTRVAPAVLYDLNEDWSDERTGNQLARTGPTSAGSRSEKWDGRKSRLTYCLPAITSTMLDGYSPSRAVRHPSKRYAA
jgi:hypothetical protein